MAVYILATLDTKGHEAAFVRDLLTREGIATRLVDTGSAGEPSVRADVSRAEVFEAAGTDLAVVRARNDRGEAVTAAARGAAVLVRREHDARGADPARRVDGVLGLGGGAGTTIGTAAMRALPLGIPKVMVSTLASGEVAHYVGTSDVLMLNAVVDIAGLNRVSKTVLANAAAAMAGMVRALHSDARAPHGDANLDRPLVAASMFGVTTKCVEHARAILDAAGFEVLVFHATGSGGRTLEALARDGVLAGVLDITTTELADELVGGVLSAGPERLTAAGRRGIPQVVSVGALDMVNFHGVDSVPERFRARRLYAHNANVTLMRTTPDECRALGRTIGSKVAASAGPAAIYFPSRGISAYDHEGQPFHDPDARAALLEGLRATAGRVDLVELELHVNDAAFAEAAARRLIAMMRARSASHA